MKKPVTFDRDSLLQSPLFEPLWPLLAHLPAERFPTLHDYNALLAMQPAIHTQQGCPLSFVPQTQGKLGFESQYEPRCYLTGEVQTRDENCHDLFNALVWLTFPRSKAAINARHYGVLTTPDTPLESQRGKVRDMATLFDESGVIVACADTSLRDLLYSFRWKELFWQQRAAVSSQMGFYIFGHGLHEKALSPYVGMTGQGLVIPVESDFFAWDIQRKLHHLDERVAQYLNNPSHCQRTQELTPVPLLGIPGWAADNTQAAYYDNQDYFRPSRKAMR